MKSLSLGFAAACLLGAASVTAFTLVESGASDLVIVTQPGATAAELNAARELAETLQTITGAALPVKEVSGDLLGKLG